MTKNWTELKLVKHATTAHFSLIIFLLDSEVVGAFRLLFVAFDIKRSSSNKRKNSNFF